MIIITDKEYNNIKLRFEVFGFLYDGDGFRYDWILEAIEHYQNYQKSFTEPRCVSRDYYESKILPQKCGE